MPGVKFGNPGTGKSLAPENFPDQSIKGWYGLEHTAPVGPIFNLAMKELFHKNLLFKILIQKAWLNSSIVLIFTAAVPFIFAVDVVIIDLADFHAGVNADRLYAEDFQGPVSGETHIAESGGDMDKQPQSADGRTPPPAWGTKRSVFEFVSTSQIQPAWFQKKAILRNSQFF